MVNSTFYMIDIFSFVTSGAVINTAMLLIMAALVTAPIELWLQITIRHLKIGGKDKPYDIAT